VQLTHPTATIREKKPTYLLRVADQILVLFEMFAEGLLSVSLGKDAEAVVL